MLKIHIITVVTNRFPSIPTYSSALCSTCKYTHIFYTLYDMYIHVLISMLWYVFMLVIGYGVQLLLHDYMDMTYVLGINLNCSNCVCLILLEYLKIKNLKTEKGLITATKSKETKNDILT